MKFPFETWHRDVILKREGQGNEGIKPEERPTQMLLNYGIVNVDKPSGPTSHMVSAYVKEIFGVKKCGHSGTLDPNVTGVLPVAIGDGSRIVQALLPAGKEYIGLMHLHEEVPRKKLDKVIEEFTGEITQLPPVKSAVRRRNRKRMIYYLDILEVDGKDVLFRVGCQAGTYIRKLCYDMGKRLGKGAHMFELRRTRVATFDESNIYTLQDIRDAFEYYKQGNDKFLRKIIQPIEKGIEHLPKLWILDSSIESVSHGRDVGLPGVSKFEVCVEAEKLVAVMSLKGELIALGTAMMSPEEMKAKDTGLAVKVHKVFIMHAR